ncbi:tRNA1(Val) (adenine(37)-N6)-methyltransferase [Pseudoroseomonas globiformis]|uniref:tRNA1(Val) (Adenine(37)-N6)-methyltransferase n=1 Tax=Teichococcus globiformis TaxID=2307229 RepID=A0ABV7FZC2_9PROT
MVMIRSEKEGLTSDTLLQGRVQLLQPSSGLRAGLDAVLLAASIPAQPGETVLEAGCGSGAVFLCLLARIPSLRIVAVERVAALAELARRNAVINGVADRVTVIEGDVTQLDELRHLAVQHACANPPYWPTGTRPPEALRSQATHTESAGDLKAWATAMARPLAHRASMTFILPTTRYLDGADALRAAHCFGVEVMPLWPRPGSVSKRVLLQARRFSHAPDRVHQGLILHDGSGWSAAAAKLLDRGEALSWG